MNGNCKKTELSHNLITPEMAALVVKEYLLPMFGSESKKVLDKKNATTNEECSLENAFS